MRLRDRLADRIPDDVRGNGNGLLGNRQELALGITLVILTAITWQEMANLIHAIPALAVMGASLTGTLAGYKQ